MEIIDGKVVSEQIKNDLKLKVKKLKQSNIVPKLVIITIGNNTATELYIRNKKRLFNELEMCVEQKILNNDIEINELLRVIDELNNDINVDGILVQSPIPDKLNINNIFEKISESKDVDGFNPLNIGKMSLGIDGFAPCTALGIMQLLKYYNIDLKGKHAVVVGRSNIVGKPIARMLLEEDATVTICHSKTVELKSYTKTADVLIVAVGKEKLIKEDMVKENVVVIDVGINFTEEGKIVGDVDYENVKKKCSYITKVPGGVGPMTVIMLAKNTINSANKRRLGKNNN